MAESAPHRARLCAPHADAGPPRRAQTPVLLRSSTTEGFGRPLFPRRGHQRGIHASTCHSPTPGQGAGWHRSARPCLSVAPCCTKAGATPLSFRDAGTMFRSPTLPAKPTGITHRSREHHSNPELAPCGTHDRPPGDGSGRSRGVRSSRSPHRVRAAPDDSFHVKRARFRAGWRLLLLWFGSGRPPLAPTGIFTRSSPPADSREPARSAAVGPAPGEIHTGCRPVMEDGPDDRRDSGQLSHGLLVWVSTRWVLPGQGCWWSNALVRACRCSTNVNHVILRATITPLSTPTAWGRPGMNPLEPSSSSCHPGTGSSDADRAGGRPRGTLTAEWRPILMPLPRIRASHLRMGSRSQHGRLAELSHRNQSRLSAVVINARAPTQALSG